MATKGFISDNELGGIPTVDFTQVDGVTYNATTPGAGQEQLYFKTDKLLYAKDSGGIEYLIGGGTTLNTNVYRIPAAVVVTTNVNTASPGATLDGYSLSSGDRVLLVGQSTGNQNGLWTWLGAATPMTRAGDYLSGSTTLAVTGMTIYVVNGTLGAGQTWRLTTTGAITIDTTTTAWTINGVAVYDNRFTLEDMGDPTKRAQFDASGITAGTLRTYTFPNASGTLALTSAPGTGYVMTAPTADADNLITVATGGGTPIRGLAIKTSDDNTTKNMLEFLSSGSVVLASVNAGGAVKLAPTSSVVGGALSAFNTPFSLDFNPTTNTGFAALNVTYEQTGTYTGTQFRGLNFIVQASGTISSGTNTVLGAVGDARLNIATGTFNALTGFSGAARVVNGATTLVGQSFASTLILTSTGNMTAGYDFHAVAPVISSTGVITTHYGFYAENLGNATTTSSVAFRADTQSGSTTSNIYMLFGPTVPSGNWSIYSNTTSASAFLGNVRVGSLTAAAVTLEVTGTSDQVQLQVTGNATQTSVLQSWRNSTPTIVASVSNLGHAAFGQATAPSTTIVVDATKSFADPSASVAAFNTNITTTYTGANAQVVIGNANIVTVNQTGGNVTASPHGARGVFGQAVASGSTNTVTGIAGGVFQATNSGAGTVTNAYGVYLFNNTNTGGGTITNSYGLFISSITTGSSISRAIKTNTGLLEFGDNAGFAGSTPTATDVILLSKVFTDPVGTNTGVSSNLTITLTTGNAQSPQAVRGTMTATYTGGNFTGNPTASRFVTTVNGTTNTATNAMAVWAQVNHSGSGTLTNGYGLRIDSATNSGGGTFTADYGIYVHDQNVATTNYALFTNIGRVSVLGSETIASATSATWKGIEFRAATATITGSTAITTATGFNYIDIAQPTLSAGSALSVTNAATVYIANAPTGAGAGPATITNPYSLWIDDGVSRFDGEAIGNSMQTSVEPNTSQTIFSNYSVVVAGPYQIDSGIVITVASGATLMIL